MHFIVGDATSNELSPASSRGILRFAAFSTIVPALAFGGTVIDVVLLVWDYGRRQISVF